MALTAKTGSNSTRASGPPVKVLSKQKLVAQVTNHLLRSLLYFNMPNVCPANATDRRTYFLITYP